MGMMNFEELIRAYKEQCFEHIAWFLGYLQNANPVQFDAARDKFDAFLVKSFGLPVSRLSYPINYLEDMLISLEEEWPDIKQHLRRINHFCGMYKIQLGEL